MISREKYLLTCLTEECAEVAQRASKAIRFGLNEVQPGQKKTNRERLADEIIDLSAIVEMVLGPFGNIEDAMNAKQEKIERFYKYSVELGEATPHKGEGGE